MRGIVQVLLLALTPSSLAELCDGNFDYRGQDFQASSDMQWFYVQ